MPHGLTEARGHVRKARCESHQTQLRALLLTVHDAADGALVELHAVARERSGLVREDVLNLTQVLIQVGRACHCGGVCSGEQGS